MYDKVRTRTDHGYRILSLQLTLSVGTDRPEVDENLPGARAHGQAAPFEDTPTGTAAWAVATPTRSTHWLRKPTEAWTLVGPQCSNR